MTQLLHEHHDTEYAGHQGIQRMYADLYKRYYWPQMLPTIKRYVNTCETCQRAKYDQQKKAGPLKPLETPDK